MHRRFQKYLEVVRADSKLSTKMAIIFYLMVFILISRGQIWSFYTHLLGDSGDAMQNVWNFWWFSRAMSTQGGWLWWTDMLYSPHGTTLMGHPLNMTLGFASYVLSAFMNVAMTYNFLYVVGYVLSGFGMYVLLRYLTRSPIVSVLGGLYFMISPFHVVHAVGQPEFNQLYVLPLWIYLLLRWWGQPTQRHVLWMPALGILSIFLSVYVFLYGLIFVGIFLWMKRAHLTKLHFLHLSLVSLMVLAVAGSYLMSIFVLQQISSFAGSHDPVSYSVDVVGLFIPGHSWIFSDHTEFFWQRFEAIGFGETGTYLSWTVLGIIGLALAQASFRKLANVRYFLITSFVFLALSLGPHLTILGVVYDQFTLPYDWLTQVVPVMNISGVPARFMLGVYVSLAALFSLSLSFLIKKRMLTPKHIVILSLILLIELWPSAEYFPTTDLSVPGYVTFLTQVSADTTVLDMASLSSMSMYYQTIHEQPMAYGYLARVLTPTDEQWGAMQNTIVNNDFSRLYRTYGVEYLVIEPWMLERLDLDNAIYEDESSIVYDLANY